MVHFDIVYYEKFKRTELYVSSHLFSKLLLTTVNLEIVENKYFFLNNVLNDKIYLPEAITDIGVLYNYYCYNRTPLPMGMTFTELSNYIFCETLDIVIPNLTTWIYKQDDNYYLEITPNYPYTYRDPEPDEVFISFEDFMKDYKPLYKAAVTREELHKLRNMFAKATIETYKNMYYDAMQSLKETIVCRHMKSNFYKVQ